MKIFLSWSRERSLQVAEALYEWLPNVIQGLEPWISVNDIEKGAAWRNEIARQLEAATVGIICLTRENLERPWLLFEAGAISKKLEDAFVCTYLLNIEPVEVKDPLAQFQSTKATEADTRKLLHTINRAQKESALPPERVDKAFEKWWPDLDQRLQSIPDIEQTEESKRPPEDILSEILVTVRSLAQQIQPGPATLLESDDLYPPPHAHSGSEVDTILRELQKMKRGLVLTALEDAWSVTYSNGILHVVFDEDDILAKRVKDSASLFHEIGRRLFGRPIRLAVSFNKRTETLAEFEKFARDKGHKVENGIVSFEKDSDAAQKFHIEAIESGFEVVLDFNQVGSYSGLDDISKLPKYWFVRLAP